MKHKLHDTLLQNISEADRLLKNLINTEEKRQIEVYTEEYYTEKLKNINLKISELIDELVHRGVM